MSQLGVFAVALRNIAVPVDFAIVGKLAQMVFPGGDVPPSLNPILSNAWIRESVIGDVFPTCCYL
jgi:hypothetical protein